MTTFPPGDFLTRAQLNAAFAAAGVGNPNLTMNSVEAITAHARGQSWGALDETWLLGECAGAFDLFLRQYGLAWESFFNCQAFSEGFVFFLALEHNKAMRALLAANPSAVVPDRPAAFELDATNLPGVNIPPGDGHSVVAAVVGGNKAIALEPQPTAGFQLYAMEAVHWASALILR